MKTCSLSLFLFAFIWVIRRHLLSCVSLVVRVWSFSLKNPRGRPVVDILFVFSSSSISVQSTKPAHYHLYRWMGRSDPYSISCNCCRVIASKLLAMLDIHPVAAPDIVANLPTRWAAVAAVTATATADCPEVFRLAPNQIACKSSEVDRRLPLSATHYRRAKRLYTLLSLYALLCARSRLRLYCIQPVNVKQFGCMS